MKIVQLVFDFILSIVGHFFPRKRKGRQCPECGILVSSDHGRCSCKQSNGSSPGSCGSDPDMGESHESQSELSAGEKEAEGQLNTLQTNTDINHLIGRAMIVTALGSYLFG